MRAVSPLWRSVRQLHSGLPALAGQPNIKVSSRLVRSVLQAQAQTPAPAALRAEPDTRAHLQLPEFANSTIANRYEAALTAEVDAETVDIDDALLDRLSLGFQPRQAKNRLERAVMLQRFQRGPEDTGSPEAQIGMLTARIVQLKEHLESHKKDHANRRTMNMMMAQRNKHLKYLRRKDFVKYLAVIDELNLPPLPEEHVRDYPAKPINKKTKKWEQV